MRALKSRFYWWFNPQDIRDGHELVRIILFNFTIFEIWFDKYQMDITIFGTTLGFVFTELFRTKGK